MAKGHTLRMPMAICTGINKGKPENQGVQVDSVNSFFIWTNLDFLAKAPLIHILNRLIPSA